MPIDSPGDLPSDPKKALEDLNRATGGLLDKVGSDTEATTQKLAEDVGDAVDDTLGEDALN